MLTAGHIMTAKEMGQIIDSMGGRSTLMKIHIEKVENGWTIETINSPEMPIRTVRVASTEKELISILETIIRLEGPPP